MTLPKICIYFSLRWQLLPRQFQVYSRFHVVNCELFLTARYLAQLLEPWHRLRIFYPLGADQNKVFVSPVMEVDKFCFVIKLLYVVYRFKKKTSRWTNRPLNPQNIMRMSLNWFWPHWSEMLKAVTDQKGPIENHWSDQLWNELCHIEVHKLWASVSYHEINGTLVELVTFVVNKIRVYHQCTLTAKQLFEFWFLIRDYLSLKMAAWYCLTLNLQLQIRDHRSSVNTQIRNAEIVILGSNFDYKSRI